VQAEGQCILELSSWLSVRVVARKEGRRHERAVSGRGSNDAPAFGVLRGKVESFPACTSSKRIERSKLLSLLRHYFPPYPESRIFAAVKLIM